MVELTLASSLHLGGLGGGCLLGGSSGLGTCCGGLGGCLLGSGNLLSLLDLSEGGLSRSGANLWLLVSLLLDDLERSTDDGSLDLLGLSGLLLGHLLGGALLVQSSVHLSPADLSGVRLAVESGLALAINKSEGLGVATNKSDAVGRVDLEMSTQVSCYKYLANQLAEHVCSARGSRVSTVSLTILMSLSVNNQNPDLWSNPQTFQATETE